MKKKKNWWKRYWNWRLKEKIEKKVRYRRNKGWKKKVNENEWGSWWIKECKNKESDYKKENYRLK